MEIGRFTSGVVDMMKTIVASDNIQIPETDWDNLYKDIALNINQLTPDDIIDRFESLIAKNGIDTKLYMTKLRKTRIMRCIMSNKLRHLL